MKKKELLLMRAAPEATRGGVTGWPPLVVLVVANAEVTGGPLAARPVD